MKYNMICIKLHNIYKPKNLKLGLLRRLSNFHALSSAGCFNCQSN